MPEPDAFAAEEQNDEPEASEVLQFDQAEYATSAPAGPTCALCKRAIDDAYYEINGKVLCATCRQRVEASFRGGSPVARAIKALVFGSVAAAAGAVAYYAIVSLTHSNWGIFAIVLGFMVGGAIRKGSGNRGGLFYQFLALFLTYSAIVGMLALGSFAGRRQVGQEKPATDLAAKKVEEAPAKTDAPHPADAGLAGDSAPRNVAKAQDGTQRDQPSDVKQANVPAGGKDAAGPDVMPDLHRRPVLLALLGVVLLVLLYANPIYHAFHFPISGLIFSFALWEAWRLNRRVKLVFNGPFRVSAADASAGAPEDVQDGG
jgi:hypothetical protein